MINIKENYISEDEEKELLSHMRTRSKHETVTRNSVVRYGSKLPYMGKTSPIPPYFLPILSRLADDNIIQSDSITVNEYHPGQSIDWHIDSESSGPTIVVLSLENEAVMGLSHSVLEGKREIILPPRSLLIMDGDERYEWEHCIHPLVQHRFSVVFRKGTNVTNNK